MISNLIVRTNLDFVQAIYHTLSSIIWDALSVLCKRSTKVDFEELERKAKSLFYEIGEEFDVDSTMFNVELKVTVNDSGLKIGSFAVEKGPSEINQLDEFDFNTKTTAENALRVIRGFASNKPIMLEGNPGCGKSSLISALAKATGNKLIRLNLSDQTVSKFC